MNLVRKGVWDGVVQPLIRRWVNTIAHRYSSLLISAKAEMQDLGIPDARQLSETEWIPGTTYETRY